MLIETLLNHVEVASSFLSHGLYQSDTLITPNCLHLCFDASYSQKTNPIVLHAGYSFSSYEDYDDDGDYEEESENRSYDDFEESSYDEYKDGNYDESYEDASYDGRFEDGFDEYYNEDDEDEDYL